jgi:hypothetical protein
MVGEILNLLEQGFNRLLGIPCAAHVFKVVFQANHGDVPIGAEEMVNHGPYGDVGKTNHVIIQNVQVHWFKNIDDLLFQSLLHGSVGTVSFKLFIPGVSLCANLGRCAVSVARSPPGGWWDFP